MPPKMTADQRQAQAILRRAIMVVKPEYFAASVSDQEHYRIHMPEEDRFKFDQIVLAALFDIHVNTPEALDTVFDDFDEEQYWRYHSTLLPIKGIGEDYFYLNEWFGGNKTLLSYPTLYDYDFHDHEFQEQARAEEFPDYQIKPYWGRLYYTWARLQIDGAFTYANLLMTASYLHSQLERFGNDQMNTWIPHRYVNGPQHGKREAGGRLWDKRIEAGGQEAQLEELRQRYDHYITERWDQLAQHCDQQVQGQVYLIDNRCDYDPQHDFIFTDKTALQAIRFRHFMQDCKAILGDAQQLETLLEQERQAAAAYLEHHYQDILAHFDPTIVKFRKKYKIILAE